MRYEIDEENAVRIWNGEEEHAFIFQPHYPNLDPFDSPEEASAWAEAAIAQMQDTTRTVPYAPNGQGLDPEYPISFDDEKKMKIQSLGIDLSTLKKLLEEL